mgnify:CR=1 FL=1
MSDIYVFAADIRQLSDSDYERELELLAADLQKRIHRFQKSDDRKRSILGKALLRHALVAEADYKGDLSEIRYGEKGKPIFPGLEFNISHSGNWVVCSISPSTVHGLDIELHRSVELDKFRKQFTPRQIEWMRQSENPQMAFFEYWTRKEAIVKAVGRGLTIPLHQLDEDDYGNFYCESKTWRTRVLPAPEKGYSMHLAFAEPNTSIHIRY